MVLICEILYLTRCSRLSYLLFMTFLSKMQTGKRVECIPGRLDSVVYPAPEVKSDNRVDYNALHLFVCLR